MIAFIKRGEDVYIQNSLQIYDTDKMTNVWGRPILMVYTPAESRGENFSVYTYFFY